MNTNKKYAIRKLAIGVASVSIGLFVANSVNSEVAQTLGSVGGGVIQAFDNGNENMSNETTKQWKPEGSIIAQGEDGVPWELYENGYLLFKPVAGKDTLSNPKLSNNSWSSEASWRRYNIKAIGFSDTVYAPEDSSGLFSYLDVEYIQTNKIDTKKVKNMSYMFALNYSLKQLDLENFDTSNVIDMSYMFKQDENLESLNVSNWNTSNVKNMTALFSRTYKLSKINVENWNTSKVVNMGHLFSGMTSLKTLDLSKWDTSKVVDMEYMFSTTDSLEELNIKNFNIRNVNNLRFFFNNLERTSLHRIILSSNFVRNSSAENPFNRLDFPSDKFPNEWSKEDGSAGSYTVEEWDKAYRNDPVRMSGTWVREKVSTKYTLNFNSGTTEQINPIEVEKNTQALLPTPTVDNTGYKFLGWSKTQDGEVITDTTNIGNPGETITLYAKWEKVDNITKQRVPIEIKTVYKADNTLDKGQRNEESGQVGEKEIVTTYKVTPITGELTESTTTENIITPMRPKVIKVGTKPTSVEKQIELSITEKQTDSLVKGKERITQGRPRMEKETTEYTVNETTGDITETKRTEVIDEGTPTVKEIGTREPVNKIINEQGKELTSEELVNYTEPNYGNPDGSTAEGDPIYNVRRITTTYKGDDTLDKGKQVVEKDGKVDGNRVIKIGTKSTLEVETLLPSIKYEKDSSREKGQENITVQGKNGIKTITTTYTVNSETGEVIEHPQKSVIIESTNTIIKVALKDKEEIVNKKDGSVVKGTTIYTVNPNTGEITETKKEEVIKNKIETLRGESEILETSKEFVGGVNPNDAPIVEELPELKVAVIKDNKGNILEVIKENEKLKDIQGYKNTGKTEVDKDNYKVYIYEKIESQKPITKEKQLDIYDKEENKEDSISDKKEDNSKENIKKKEELPKTSSSMLATFGLFGAFGIRKNRKKK